MDPPDDSGAPSPVVVVATNDAWNVVNYRKGLITGLQERGYRIAVLAPPGRHSTEIERMGVEFHPVPMAARGMSPLADLRTLLAFRSVFRRVRPAAVLGFTVKPNIYGSIASGMFRIPVISNVSGLGTVFTRDSMLRRLVEALYRYAFRQSQVVFFQNRDDATLFTERKIVRPEQIKLLPGSGIDLNRFAPTQRARASKFEFLFVGRLLWAKGLSELAKATRELKSAGEDFNVRIAGIPAGDDKDSVSLDTINSWEKEGLIDYLGSVKDVRPLIASADCVVLPSYYREGVPRSLLEAAAMATPTITTDWPGCRDAVDDGATGYLCQPRSISSLASAMRRMLQLDGAERQAMGRAARTKMERQFSETVVIDAYLDALGNLAAKRS